MNDWILTWLHDLCSKKHNIHLYALKFFLLTRLSFGMLNTEILYNSDVVSVNKKGQLAFLVYQ